MPARRKIYIIGFMGSGKTTAGKKLAALLGWSFIDLDERTETVAGMKIPEIFSQLGEEYFRKSESESLKALENLNDAIISTGGGAPCYNENMEFMLATGITVYLKLTPEQLKSRLSHSKTVRPLVKDLEGKDLLDFITEKLSQREKYYERAEITIKGIDIDINQMLMLVKAAL
jgi:shikimate kinase